jgi:hypothetical protein
VTRTTIVGLGLVVLLLVTGGVTAALVGPLAAAAPSGVPQPAPATGSGSGDVLLSADAAVHPAAATVLAQVQRYFDAINAGDYASWQSTVAPERATKQPEQAWKASYRSTRDGTIRIDRIDDETAGALLVRVRFISTQDLADAPDTLAAPRICWRVTLPMQGAPPRIGPTQGGSSLSEAC